MSLPESKDELLQFITQSYMKIVKYLQSLREEEILHTRNDKDWSVRDFVLHLNKWEKGILALLNGQDRWEAMGVTRKLGTSGSYDKINEAIRQKFAELDYNQLIREFNQTHEAILSKIGSMERDDLSKPYHSYDPKSDWNTPVIALINGNTFDHYEEHLESMKKIINRS